MKRYIANLGVSQIFISLLIVILIMSYSSYSIYKSSISNIYDNIKETNKIATQSAMLYFDHVFQTMNNLILTIDKLPPYEYPTLENGNLDSHVAHKFTENLTTTMLQNNYVEEVIVVFENNDLAFTTQGTINSRLLFTKKYVSSQYPYSFWDNLIGTEHSLKVLPSTEFAVYSAANSTYQKRNLMIVAGDTQYSTTDKDIFVVIDTDKLMTYFGQTSAIPGSSLKILDQNKNTVFSSDENLELIEVLNQISTQSSNSLRADGLDLKTDNYEYSIFTSEYNGFVYISKIPYEFKNLNTVASGNRTIIFISIASAVLISLFISFYLYRPVRKIMKVLGKENSKGNDFSKIQSGITKIVAENEQYKQQLDYIDNDLKRSTIVKLFDRFSQSEQQTIQLEKYYTELFSAHYSVIGTIQVRDLQNITSFSKPFFQIEQDIIKRLQLAELNAHVFHYNNNVFILLISSEQLIGFDKLNRKISHAITQLEKDELQGYELWCCLSKAFRTTVDHCITAFRDVENASRFKQINNKQKVISVEKLDFVWNLYLPYENMEKLSNYILRGKVEDSVQLVKDTLQENVERNIHEHHFKYIAQSIFFYMYRNIANTSQSVQQLSQIENAFLDQLEFLVTSEEIERLLIDVIVQLASLSNKAVEVKLNPTFIMQYIELHYMENMYLEDISAVLDTTPKYFSNYFKKTFGINYVEYLNKVRLTHARKMLKETTLSIGDIGAKTGYLNSSTFTTTFRKYYGISPSEYRRQQHEQIPDNKAN